MKKRNWQNSIVAELMNHYSKRKPICRHFLHCGGCSFLDFEYKDQLEVKRKKVVELFSQISNSKSQISNEKIIIFGHHLNADSYRPEVAFGLSAPPILGGEYEEYGYRTRMDYVVGSEGIGLRKRRRFDEIEFLNECFLIDNNILQFLKEVYKMGREIGLEPYDLRTHEGEWRYLSVRINEKNEVMVILVTKESDDIETKIDKLSESITNYELRITEKTWSLKSVYHLVNDGMGDSNFGEVVKYWGDEFLQYSICNIQYAIGPNTFFQNNIKLLNGLMDKLLGYVSTEDNVLDLYCGVGTLSLPVAKKCREVLGVELMAESIELARKNAKKNGIENVEFEAGSVEDVFKTTGKNLPPRPVGTPPILGGELPSSRNLYEYNILMLDPPRKGLEKVAEKLLDRDFEKIIYMSCNPLSLVKDLQLLTKKWKIDEVTLWDFYPQTPHVEGLVFLTKI